ncbi:MAG: hypothetical protein ACTSX6_03295 [Candidatus Heimdallarchaeaceae archaeon]
MNMVDLPSALIGGVVGFVFGVLLVSVLNMYKRVKELEEKVKR